MRHMYDRDGMIAYAGEVRASVRWRSSRYRKPSQGHRMPLHRDDAKVAEVELDLRTHKERIADILANSKWSNPKMNVEG